MDCSNAFAPCFTADLYFLVKAGRVSKASAVATRLHLKPAQTFFKLQRCAHLQTGASCSKIQKARDNKCVKRTQRTRNRTGTKTNRSFCQLVQQVIDLAFVLLQFFALFCALLFQRTDLGV
jgi:fatty acid-binding protein DegV